MDPFVRRATVRVGRRAALLLLPVAALTAGQARASGSLGSSVTDAFADVGREGFDAAGRLARSVLPAASDSTTSASRRRLAAAVGGAMGGQSGVIGVSVFDRRTGSWWHHRGDAPVATGSVSKVLVVGTALRRARSQSTPFTASQREQARLAITESDNPSADALYQWIDGHQRLALLARDLGMAVTAQARPATHWGLTLSTPNDLVRMMMRLAAGSPATHPADDAHVLELMGQVIDGQRWGVGTVRSATVDVHVKNGWMVVGDSWVINSVGDVRGGGRDYIMALMQADQPEQDSGIARASRIGRAVFGAMAEPLR